MPILVDMAAARAIHRERLRSSRAALWPDLDARWFRAAEQGDSASQADVAAEKQALRDAPADPRIDAAADTDALTALTLDALTADE